MTKRIYNQDHLKLKVFGDKARVSYSSEYHEVNTYLYRGMKLSRVQAYGWATYIDIDRTLEYHEQRIAAGRLDPLVFETFKSELKRSLV